MDAHLIIEQQEDILQQIGAFVLPSHAFCAEHQGTYLHYNYSKKKWIVDCTFCENGETKEYNTIAEYLKDKNSNSR